MRTIKDHIRSFFRSFVVEYQLRRELRKPLNEGPSCVASRWPDLNETSGLGGESEIIDEMIDGADERLNKQLAKAKRRDVCVSSSWRG